MPQGRGWFEVLLRSASFSQSWSSTTRTFPDWFLTVSRPLQISFLDEPGGPAGRSSAGVRRVPHSRGVSGYGRARRTTNVHNANHHHSQASSGKMENFIRLPTCGHFQRFCCSLFSFYLFNFGFVGHLTRGLFTLSLSSLATWSNLVLAMRPGVDHSFCRVEN